MATECIAAVQQLSADWPRNVEARRNLHPRSGREGAILKVRPASRGGGRLQIAESEAFNLRMSFVSRLYWFDQPSNEPLREGVTPVRVLLNRGIERVKGRSYISNSVSRAR